MEIIVGCAILKNNKILMVREAKKKCYGKLSFPAGHIKENETVFEGAIRETLEETGCKVELKKAFPIFVHNNNDGVILMHFLAELVEEGFKYNTDEILETKWLSIEEIKNMDKGEFRSYPVVENIINSLENNNLYELEMYRNLPSV